MKLLLIILLGALVGLRNEITYVKKGKGPIGGFRSFIFISILGYFSGVLLYKAMPISVVISCFIMLIIAIYYYHDLATNEKFGLTMELSAAIVYLAGFLIETQLIPAKITVAITIIVAFLLAHQKQLRHILFALKEQEVTQVALFATLTFVILPFLPDKSFSIFQIIPNLQSLPNLSPTLLKILSMPLINPFKLWIFVVLVSGIELSGYMLSRIVGTTTSVTLTALISGYISSTSSTIAFSKQANRSSNKLLYLSAILLANASSFVEVYILLSAISLVYLRMIALGNLVLLLIPGIAGTVFLLLSRKVHIDGHKLKSHHQEKIFDIKFAFNFALVLGVVQVITKIAYILMGNTGFLVTSALAGFTGINAVLINTGELLNMHAISSTLALQTFFVVNLVNLLAKGLYIRVAGEKRIFAWYSTVIIITLGILYAVLFI